MRSRDLGPASWGLLGVQEREREPWAEGLGGSMIAGRSSKGG